MPTNDIGYKQLLTPAEQPLQLDVFMQPNTTNLNSTQNLHVKKPTIVVAGSNICCEGVSVLDENSPVKVILLIIILYA